MKTVFLTACLALLSTAGLFAMDSWSLASPNGDCEIAVALNSGKLSFQVSRQGKLVLSNSPLGAHRADQSFEHGLALEQASEVERRREAYELFAGGVPQVDQILNRWRLTFANANRAKLIVELAASNEGVAFRYAFPETVPEVHILKEELTGFRFPSSARGWLQPYHAASDYTPAYEDFYFNVSPGDPPPQSRGKPLGWCFPCSLPCSRRGYLGVAHRIRH